jgi:SAM-dependent methyltransferase
MVTAAPVTSRRAVSGPDWFESWFDSPHYHRLYAHRDEREAAAFVERLVKFLEPEAGASVLDLGSGAGRHSVQLASRGFEVTGIDLSAASICRARQHAAPNLMFLRRDMRRPFGAKAFDVVFNLFTSFGYFEGQADHLKVVRNIARALKPGGTLVLDYLNVQYAESHRVADELIERDGVVYQVSRWSDAGHLYKRIEVRDGQDAEPLVHVERVAKFGLDDFRAMFRLCGLTMERVFGDYGLNGFDPATSPRLILVASRPESPSSRVSPRQIPANAADGFRRHAEIRGEHRLRNAGGDGRVHADELEVPLLSRCAE